MPHSYNQSRRHSRRPIDESHAFDHHNRGNPDPAYAHEEERNFPGPLINPVPRPVVSGPVPTLQPREVMIAGGMEPGGSSRKFQKSKRDKDKTLRHGPTLNFNKLDETTFEVGPPTRATQAADLSALARQRVDPTPSGIPDFYNLFRAVPVETPVDPGVELSFVNNPKVENAIRNQALRNAQVPQRQNVVPPRVIQTEMTFSNSESDDEFIPGTAPGRMIPYVQTTLNAIPRKLEEPQPEMTFTDSESEEEDDTGTDAVPVPPLQQHMAVPEMTFTDSESEEEEEVESPAASSVPVMMETKNPVPPKQLEPEVQMTFTDSESEEEEDTEAAPPAPNPNAVVQVAKKNVVPPPPELDEDDDDDIQEMRFDSDGWTNDSGSEELDYPRRGKSLFKPMFLENKDTVPLKLEEIKQNLEEITFTDSESEPEEEVAYAYAARQDLREEPQDSESQYRSEDVQDSMVTTSLRVVKRNVPQKREEPEEMTFTDSESESEEVPVTNWIPAAKWNVPQKIQEPEEMTFTDSESDGDY